MLPPLAITKARKISYTPEACDGAAAVRSGRGWNQAQESKARFADYLG
jgi:hypothetical protein